MQRQNLLTLYLQELRRAHACTCTVIKHQEETTRSLLSENVCSTVSPLTLVHSRIPQVSILAIFPQNTSSIQTCHISPGGYFISDRSHSPEVILIRAAPSLHSILSCYFYLCLTSSYAPSSLNVQDHRFHQLPRFATT